MGKYTFMALIICLTWFWIAELKLRMVKLEQYEIKDISCLQYCVDEQVWDVLTTEFN